MLEGPEGQAGDRRAASRRRCRSARARSAWCAVKLHRGDRARSQPEHFAAPEDRALDHAHHAQRRGDARHAEARRDQLPRRSISGDPEVLIELAKDNPDIDDRRATVDIGFRFIAFNERRPPFDDVAFRRALSLAIDRRLMVAAAWHGLRGAGQLPRLAGAELLARSRRSTSSRPALAEAQEDPEGRRLPCWSAASCTTRTARRKADD